MRDAVEISVHKTDKIHVISQESGARYVISVAVNPIANVRLGVPSAGTSCLIASQYEDLGHKKRHIQRTEYATSKYVCRWEVHIYMSSTRAGRGRYVEPSSHYLMYTLKTTAIGSSAS